MAILGQPMEPAHTHRLNQPPAKKRPGLKAALKQVPGLTALFRFGRSVFDPVYRSEQRLIRAQPDMLFQPYARTSFDRHPDIFAFVRAALPGEAPLRILSYGCSTGEEVFTLRHYFPTAEIVGMDINPHSIALCRSKQEQSQDTRLRFVCAATPQEEKASTYDAVFCLSVLRHGELGVNRPDRCDHLIRFADFEQMVGMLSRCLKPGGYLAMAGSNFRFADTRAARDFEVVYRWSEVAPRSDTPIYGPDDRLLANAIYNDMIFHKKVVA